MKKKRCSFNPSKLEDFQSGGCDWLFSNETKQPVLWRRGTNSAQDDRRRTRLQRTRRHEENMLSPPCREVLQRTEESKSPIQKGGSEGKESGRGHGQQETRPTDHVTAAQLEINNKHATRERSLQANRKQRQQESGKISEHGLTGSRNRDHEAGPRLAGPDCCFFDVIGLHLYLRSATTPGSDPRPGPASFGKRANRS